VINGTVGVTTTDKTATLRKLLEDITKLQVYVGIPEEAAPRDDGGPLNNAQIAFLMTQGVRSGSMREEMQPGLDAGSSYGSALQMYITAHGSPLWSIPPRPIIEPAIEAPGNKEPIAEDLGKAAKAVLNGNPAEARQHLREAGQEAENAVRDWFDDPRNGWPVNAPSTIKEKGSDRPLIDTGELRKKITYVVKGNE